MATASRLAGKRALITGAGRGIGRGIACEFAREGADVVLHYSHKDDPVDSALAEIKTRGTRATAIQARFEQASEVQRVGREALAFLGGLDILVNNAGITLTLPFEKVTVEQFDFLYQVSVRAPFFLAQTCCEALVKSSGSIINISSIHSQQGAPGHSVYAGTKGAITAMSRELAIELSLKGVRVNTIAPGAIVTENYAKFDPPFDAEAFGKLVPCGFAGEPRDIARLAVFLASTDARYIVGQTITADGGTTAWMPFSAAFRNPPGTMGEQYVPGMK
jgi:3-oxoacyl-[acyl-carrier protein] reductase